jgi:Protein of unknown function (DUF2934)
MSDTRELRQRAERFRRLWRWIIDPAAVRAIREVADELDLTAEELERRQSIRDRAHELWTEHGRPWGRDVEFWMAAEREVDSRHVPRQQSS